MSRKRESSLKRDFKGSKSTIFQTDIEDWRSQCETVPKRWCEARKRNLYTDVDFEIGTGDSVKNFSAHKIVLAFSSPVFEAMLFGSKYSTSLDEEIMCPIVMKDIDPEAFEICLRHIYGETLTFSSVAEAAKTCLVADKFLVSDLLSLAKDYISKSVMDDTQLWEVIRDDELFFITIVNKKCLDYISENASTILKSDSLGVMSSKVLKDILQMEKIKMSECELLYTLVRWGGSANLKTDTKLKYILKPFLCYIRFSNLSVTEFCEFNDSYPFLINTEDSLAIIKHLHNPLNYKLPQWCSASTKIRNTTESQLFTIES